MTDDLTTIGPEATPRLSNYELADRFYKAHELDFQRAVLVQNVKARDFPFSADRFDDWLVGEGQLPRTARECGSTLERSGINELRYSIRVRLNRAARTGKGLVRAFTVEAKGGKWRVELSEAFLADRPRRLLTGIKATHAHLDLELDQARELVIQCPYLESAEKTTCLVQLDSANQFSFFMSQSASMALAAVQAAEEGLDVDFAAMRRAMRDAMDRATGAKPPMKAKPKQRRRKSRAKKTTAR